jgi:hypothetical protein
MEEKVKTPAKPGFYYLASVMIVVTIDIGFGSLMSFKGWMFQFFISIG